MSRALILIPVLLLGACGVPVAEPTGALLVINLAAIPIMQRTPFDAIYSAIHDQDCSVVRWDSGLSYCRPIEPPPTPPPFCSRSLGQTDCWADPASLTNRPHEQADGPRTLTPAQEADRIRTWPVF
jgi:hypothetical protein